MNTNPCRKSAFLMLCLGCVASEPTLFVVGPLPPDFLGKEAFVLPLSKPEEITLARKLAAFAETQSYEYVNYYSDEIMPVVWVEPGSDGMNRNVLAAGSPLWNWHVTGLAGWRNLSESHSPCPSDLEIAASNGALTRQTYFHCFGSTIIAELNAPLALYGHLFRTDNGTVGGLVLYWTHDDPNLEYLVEWTPSLNSPAWRRIDNADGSVRLTRRALYALQFYFDGGFFRLVTQPKPAQ